jgi:hypothetical protein
MPKPRKPGIHIERIKRGAKRYTFYYYRVGQGKRIRLPDEYGTREFWEAYDLAKERGRQAEKPLNPVILKAKELQKRTKARLEKSVRRARLRAKKMGVEFDIEPKWAVDLAERQKFTCVLTGIHFYSEIEHSGRVHPFAPSLDRIDCSRGYTKDNVRIVIFSMNIMLLDWGTQIFEYVVKRYRANSGQREKVYSLAFGGPLGSDAENDQQNQIPEIASGGR